MKMRTFIPLWVVCVIYPVTLSCTTFVLRTSQGWIFGRNLDWKSDMGMIIVNPRGAHKTSFVNPEEQSAEWTSTYGSVTFNQFGRDFPFGGINEKGLVVEIMLSDAAYPEPDKRACLNEIQWVQYQLDNCATLNDVQETDKKIRIAPMQEELHYLICDAAGNTAVVEFIDGKMTMYKGNSLPHEVLENEPYKQSLAGKKNGDDTRFATVCEKIGKFKMSKEGSAVEYAFEVLEEVALNKSWSVVYEVWSGNVYFTTSSHPQIRQFNYKTFDFNCTGKFTGYQMEAKDSGNIQSGFIVLDESSQLKHLATALQANDVQLSDAENMALTAYIRAADCNAR